MHRMFLELADGRATSTATLGLWNAPASTLRWITAGDQAPLRITADGELLSLDGRLYLELGDEAFPEVVASHTVRLGKGERLLLLSDSFTDPDRPGHRGRPARTSSRRSRRRRHGRDTGAQRDGRPCLPFFAVTEG